MTIFHRALEFVAEGMVVGLGSGRAATRFVELLGEKVRNGMNVRGVATSQSTAELARTAGVPLVTLTDVPHLDLTVDGADEVDPQLNLIKGYGRALVREKIVVAASKKLVILVGQEKLVPVLGSRGRLPVEVVSFAVPTFLRRAAELGCPGNVYLVNGQTWLSDNGHPIVDCQIGPMADPADLNRNLCDVPGVVDTGLFLKMADVVLVGDDASFELREERRRP
jgi:ribose 5-phosphate isomerase A